MNNPLLQVALDVQTSNEAITITEKIIPSINVVEAGTILCISEGLTAVSKLRAAFPQHIILADIKMADAGSTLAKMCAEHGADWVTVICCAPIATIEKALQTMKDLRAEKGDVQIELYGNWTWDEAITWKSAGVTQLVYHRGRDAAAAGQAWTEVDVSKIKKLCDMGFEVSVTGGIEVSDVHFFQGLAIKAFIAGRSLTTSSNPLQAAQLLRTEIDKYWKP